MTEKTSSCSHERTNPLPRTGSRRYGGDLGVPELRTTQSHRVRETRPSLRYRHVQLEKCSIDIVQNSDQAALLDLCFTSPRPDRHCRQTGSGTGDGHGGCRMQKSII